jgi:hypothetical protein
MAEILFANDAISTVAGSITSVSLSVNLAAGTGVLFPNPSGGDYFLATFIDAATGTQKEIVKVTAKSGDTVTIVRAQEGTTAEAWNAGDLFRNQLTAGTMQNMFQKGDINNTSIIYFGVDTGSVNSMVVSSVSPDVSALAEGMVFLVRAANTNTGPTTVSIKSFGAEAIVNANNSALAAGQIVSGEETLIVYSAAANFQLLGSSGGGTPAISNFILGADSSSTANLYTIATTPTFAAMSDIVARQVISFKPHASNTGAVTMTANGLTAYPIVRPDRLPLLANDIISNGICLVSWAPESSVWVIVNPNVWDNQLLNGNWVGGLGGSVNVYTATLPGQGSSLAVGTEIAGYTWTANTGPATLNVNSQGAIGILRQNGSPLSGGEIYGVFNLVFTGSNWFIPNPYVPAVSTNSSYLMSSGTITVPPGMTRARAQGWGAGGGGGGSSGFSAGSGGGGGGMFDMFITGLTPGAGISCTIGAGGGGGGPGGNGGSGGYTTFGGFALANGGGGGEGVSGFLPTVGGAGGTAAIYAGIGIAPSGYPGGLTVPTGGFGMLSGAGGGNPFGASSNVGNGDTAGSAGSFPGGGGNGGALTSSGGGGAGGFLKVQFFP